MHAAAAQPALNDIVALSAQALSDAIRQRHVSCREVMAAYLTHIDRVNPAVNAIVARRDSATRCCAKPMSVTPSWRPAIGGAARHAAGPWGPDEVRGMVTSMGLLVFRIR